MSNYFLAFLESAPAAGGTAIFVIGALLVVLIALLVVLIHLLKALKEKTTPRVSVTVQTREDAAAPAAKPVPAAAAQPAPAPAPIVEAGIPGEVVAAITAAVEAFGEGRYRLNSVSRAPAATAAPEEKAVVRAVRPVQGRQAWGRAGIAANTEPF